MSLLHEVGCRQRPTFSLRRNWPVAASITGHVRPLLSQLQLFFPPSSIECRRGRWRSASLKPPSTVSLNCNDSIPSYFNRLILFSFQWFKLVSYSSPSFHLVRLLFIWHLNLIIAFDHSKSSKVALRSKTTNWKGRLYTNTSYNPWNRHSQLHVLSLEHHINPLQLDRFNEIQFKFNCYLFLLI